MDNKIQLSECGPWTVNSTPSLTAYTAWVAKMLDEYKYLTFPKPRIGPDRSLDQNALFHVWCTEYCAFLLGKDKGKVTRGELAGTKRKAKQLYQQHKPESRTWLVHDLVDPFSGDSRKDYTSSASWKRGEMFDLLTWLQMIAANDGFLLESKGEFEKLNREQHAA